MPIRSAMRAPAQRRHRSIEPAADGQHRNRPPRRSSTTGASGRWGRFPDAGGDGESASDGPSTSPASRPNMGHRVRRAGFQPRAGCTVAQLGPPSLPVPGNLASRTRSGSAATCSIISHEMPAQRHLEPPLPPAACLARRLADVDVEEATARRPLGQRAEEVRRAVATIALRRHRALEGEVIPLRPLRLDGPVVGPLALLQAEIHAGGRSLQDDAEPQFQDHSLLPLRVLPSSPSPHRRLHRPRPAGSPHVESHPAELGGAVHLASQMSHPS